MANTPYSNVFRQISQKFFSLFKTNEMSNSTLSNTLSQIAQNKVITNGWDMVVNILEDTVNTLFQIKFQSSVKTSWKTMSTSYCEAVPNPIGKGRVAEYTKLDVSLEQPQMKFLPNNQNKAQIHFYLTGTLKTANKIVDSSFDPSKDANPDDPSLEWDTSNISKADFMATVPLEEVQGKFGNGPNVFSIVLDLPKGTFTSSIFSKAKNPTKMETEVKNYFISNDVQYVIYQLDSVQVKNLPAVSPVSFKINTMTTNSGKNIFQLFITTTGKSQVDTTIPVNEPVPDGCGYTLMTSQSILSQMGNVIVQEAIKGNLKVIYHNINEDVLGFMSDSQLKGQVMPLPALVNNNSFTSFSDYGVYFYLPNFWDWLGGHDPKGLLMIGPQIKYK